MRTLQIGLDWFPERAGGLSRYFYEFVAAAPSVGLDVRGLVTGSANIAASTAGKVTAFAASTAPMPQRLLAARTAIGGALSSFDPQVVGSHFALYTRAALDRIDRPLVAHFHGPWALEVATERRERPSVMRQWIEASTYRRADLCVVLSAAFGRVLSESYGVAPDRIQVIPGGLDAERFRQPVARAEARQRLGWPADRRIVFAVRRLVRRMGLESAIAAIARIKTTHPDILLIIGGRGPLQAELAKAIEDGQLGEHARLVGFVAEADLPLAYRAADLSLVPTASLEGFGLIAAESLAAGTPVLVTPVGGLPEVVTALEPELVLEGGSPEQIAAGLDAALSGRIRLPDAEACSTYAASHFGWPKVAADVRDAYARLL